MKARQLLLIAICWLQVANQIATAIPTTLRNQRLVSPLQLLPRVDGVKLPISIGRKGIPCPPHVPKPVPRKVIYSQTVDLPSIDPSRADDIVWSRLLFVPGQTSLRMPEKKPAKAGWGEQLPGDIVKITALADPNKSVQYLNAETLEQWSYRSAYFNGGRLLIEVLADPTLPSKPDDTVAVVIDSVIVNNQVGRATSIYLPPPNSLCTTKDERKPSRDPRQGRLYPASCTAFTINDGKHGCQVTAGHCFADGTDATEQVLQADVPLSTTLLYGGKLFAIHRHPPADKQWAVDPQSVQFGYATPSEDDYALGDLSKGEDWAVLGTFRNPNHGQTFREFHRGQQYTLAPVTSEGQVDPSLVKRSAKVVLTGYGTSPLAGDDKVKKALDLTQQSVVGTLVHVPDAGHVRHRADSHGGNSGSPIVLAGSNTVIGIHTNGGCDPNDPKSSNWGSTVAMPGLRQALGNPLGVCAGQ